jgi:hypothetical protein
MNIALETIKQLREDAAILDSMRGVYPGDISGDMGEDVYLMEAMAMALAAYDWVKVAQLYRNSLPEVMVTYG